MITSDFDLSIREAMASYDKRQIFLLTDENTSTHCLPILRRSIEVDEIHILAISSGDINKNIASVEQIWDFLMGAGATRSSVLINLGGGMLTDLGGFAASTYMRGIPFVNIPTTLLAMVDAANGGKTGFNYKGMKNAIGTFQMAQQTIIYPEFLKTLPMQELLSGYAEMLKHGLLASPIEWYSLLHFDVNQPDWEELAELLERSMTIKNYIVEQDPTETGMRKTLNFGHTIGHALEELSFSTPTPLLHGYAVLYGMIAELYLSVKRYGLSKEVLQQLVDLMLHYYGKIAFSCKDYEKVIDLMRHDKKNAIPEQINFTLLSAIGNAHINQVVDDKEIEEALEYLFTL